jgi:hypothetical protein
MTVTREIKESPMGQGVDEIIAYTLTTTPWGSSPSSVSVVVYDVTTGARTDVTSVVMPTNSPSATLDVITLSPLKLLTAEHIYRVEVKFTCSGNAFEAYCIVEGLQ